MNSVFELNTFEEFELWLQGLTVSYKTAGKRLGSDEALPGNHDYRRELKGTLSVIGDLIERCPKLLETELVSQGAALEALKSSEESERSPDREALTRRFGDFISFWDFLIRYRVVGLSMVRHPRLPLTEFKAYLSILSNRIATLRQTAIYGQFRKKYFYMKYHHIIHRDILAKVELASVREELERVCLGFCRVLGVLDYFQKMMRKSFKYHKLLILLTYFHSTYIRLMQTLDHSHKFLGYLRPELNEEVHSIRFALKMEIRRIFGEELKRVDSEHKLDELYSRMEAALGLLRNITQQSFTGLVSKLSPDFAEDDLFGDMRRLEHQSLQLISDLNQLHSLTFDFASNEDDDSFRQLCDTLSDFREGSMRLLYFKDWSPFEQFDDELKDAQPQQRAFIVHRMEVYLSTLIGEVSKRGVLTRTSQMAGSSAM